MKKQEVHIGLNELKSIIKETLKPIMESYYPMSGSCTYTPGENADITEEEYDELANCMPEEFTVSFYTESSGGDGYYTPDETYVVPNEDDVEEIRAAIANIQNPDLKDKIEMEFNEWLDSADPDMDYDEPDPDRYRDEMNENNSNYGKEEYWFKEPFHDEPGDEHFEDPEQIAKDNDEAWHDHDAMFPSYDPRSTEYSNDPTRFPDSNHNAEYEYLGRTYAMNAQQNDDEPNRWLAQSRRGTDREESEALSSWFPADFNDEQYSDSNYVVGHYGQVNESVKKYIRRLVKEAMEGDSSKQYVIQTRTGGYLMDIKDDSVHYDDETLILSAIVGRTPVSILVYEQDYQNLVSNGKPCEGQYKTLNRGGDSSPEMDCTITLYNA